jgi:hypothetical protein
MFKEAIEQVGNFTRPIHFISNVYGETFARPGAATLFFVNDQGDALTCKHVTDVIRQAASINEKYQQFQAEKKQLQVSGSFNKKMKDLKARYGYDQPNATCQLLYQVVDCADLTSIDLTDHPQYDLALIRMKGFTQKMYQGHARFARASEQLQPGVFLCRLGFPFPEFNNFNFDISSEQIQWTSNPSRTVRFPLEGMVTRHFGEPNGGIVGVEISTPGLKGQSGGPLFDAQGVVYGMQSMTHHLHLGFDMNNQEVFSEGRKIRITNQPMLHVGHCVHVDIIKKFLAEHQVPFTEV